jgi:hypothetical protein
MRHESALANSFRSEDQNVSALCVQLLKLRRFLSPTDKRKREAHFFAALNIAPP